MIADKRGEVLSKPLPIACPTCLTLAAPGTIRCATCGTRLVPGTAPLNIEFDDDTEPLPIWPMGEVILSQGESVTLDIGQTQLLLPMTENLVLGRLSRTGYDDPPDVDLNLFNAQQKGVSRKHVLIRRGNYLLFVMDLDSTNGTWLNGRRLLPHHDRLLRDGDEL